MKIYLTKPKPKDYLVLASFTAVFLAGYFIGTHTSQFDLEALVEQVEPIREAIRFGFTRGSYETTVKLSEKYNLPQEAYLAWEYGICEGYGEKYLVMLGGAIGDSTWFKQYVDGTLCEECRFWFEANKEMLRPFDSMGGWR